MTQKFIETIKNYKEPLFYNTKGSPEAYKLAIRHLSASSSCALSYLSSQYIYPIESLCIVDLEKETINRVSDKIVLIPLKVLS